MGVSSIACPALIACRPSRSSCRSPSSIRLRGGAVVKLLLVDLRGGDAGAYLGGGVYAGSGSQLIAFGSSIRGNRAAIGAGIAATGGAVIKLQNSDVSSNAALHGIYLSSATLELIESTVADNHGAGVTAASSTVTVIEPPSGVNLTALVSRLVTARSR